MKMQEQTEILKHFDYIFETVTLKHIDFRNMKLLKALFNYFEEDLYTPSIKYERLRTKQIRISDKLELTFTQEQQELFEKYWEVLLIVLTFCFQTFFSYTSIKITSNAKQIVLIE